MSSLGFMCIHKTFAFRFGFAVEEGDKNSNLPIQRRLPLSVLGGLDDCISCVLSVQHGPTKPVRGP